MRTSLFVYGTLISAAKMDTVLAGAARWRVVGPAAVAGVLYDLGAYPGMRLGGISAALVPGLLVELEPEGSALRVLDAYEGVDEGLFARRRISLQRPPAEHRTAWIYEYRASVDGLRSVGSWPPDAAP